MHQNETRKFIQALSLFFGILVFVTGCSSPKPSAQTETMLLSCGFKQVSTTTPAQLAQVSALQPGKISVVKHKGKTWYVYPDAPRQTLYVGNADQYQSYIQTAQDVQLSRGMARAGVVIEDEISVSLGAAGVFED
jgi:hypothetical protein